MLHLCVVIEGGVFGQAEVDQLRATLRGVSTHLDREQLVATTIEATSLVLSLAMCNPASMRRNFESSMLDGSAAKQHSRAESLRILVCSACR